MLTKVIFFATGLTLFAVEAMKVSVDSQAAVNSEISVSSEAEGNRNGRNRQQRQQEKEQRQEEKAQRQQQRQSGVRVSRANTDAIEDMDEFGFFNEKNSVFNSQTAEQKKKDLWTMITKDEEMQDLIWADFATQFTAAKNGSFCQDSDELRRNRQKIAHRQGVIGQIRWESTGDHDYTGFYETGIDHAIIRFSQTVPITDESTGLMPSLAIKALRNDAKSQNIFGMPSFLESDSWDFFNDTMKNRVEPLEPADEQGDNDQDLLDTIIAKMAEGDKWPFSTAIGNFAEYNETEQLDDDDVVTPYELHFTSPFKGHEYATDTWWENLLEIGEEGAKILEVYGLADIDATPQHIADVYLETELVTSKFGDERLFFQHVSTKKDFKFWERATKREFNREIQPKFDKVIHDWDISAWPDSSEEAGEEFFLEQIEQFGCPFGWLWQPSNKTTPPVRD